MPAVPASISPDALRFVRLCRDLSRAVAQRDAAAAKLPKKERHALEAGNPAIAEAARETLAAWSFRAEELSEATPAVCAHCGAAVAPKPAPVVHQDQPPRDCRVRAMRRFFAVCKASGLNVKDAEAMTAALAKYLCCIIPSRARLSSGQWSEATAAVELGVLFW